MAGLRTRSLVGAGLLALALTGCGGDGSGGLPTSLPTERPTLPTLPALPTPTLPTLPALPTVTLPTVTLPTVTLPALPTVPGSTPDDPTAPPETTEPPAVDEEQTQTDEPDAAEPVVEDAEADGGSGWWWLLILLIAGAIAAATVVVLRRRRETAAWAAATEEPLEEAMWLRDTLVPNLLSQGPDGRAGIWAIGRPRVLTLQQRLGELGAQAPDVPATRRVEALSAAVDALRRVLDQADTLVDFGGTSIAAALQQSQYELDDAIRALQPPPEEGEEERPVG